ncbi:hypothetical protein [Vogesella indigofera]|uniref:hypothetical protein n=1 Tax=Vogesella indigofera TaxID=45465 RepID=UPI00234F99C2|nr:hypothetical protein [Vogesella indigofera]MDC7711508.1 hypothetical protein [Vogesella indigofera]
MTDQPHADHEDDLHQSFMADDGQNPLLPDDGERANRLANSLLYCYCPSLVSRAASLCKCVDDGLEYWRTSFYDDAQAFPSVSLANEPEQDASPEQVDTLWLVGWLAGYSLTARQAASAIQPAALHAANHIQLGRYSTYPEAIRSLAMSDDGRAALNAKDDEDEYRVSDRHIYAMLAVIAAREALQDIEDWHRYNLSELTNVYVHDGLTQFGDISPTQYSGVCPSIEDWWRSYPDEVERWTREQWATVDRLQEEASMRESAVFALERSRKWLLAAQLADKIDPTTMQSLVASVVAEQREQERGVKRAEFVDAGGRGGKWSPWGWAYSHWREQAEAFWLSSAGSGKSIRQAVLHIIELHKEPSRRSPGHPARQMKDITLRPPHDCDEQGRYYATGEPSDNVVRGQIGCLALKSARGRKHKTT